MLSAKSFGDVDWRQSSRKGREVSNGVCQSMIGVWIYCRRYRIVKTVNILSMAVSLPGWSLNKAWIGPAMNSNPAVLG